MKSFAKYISNHSKFILLIGILLLIPSIYFYINTRINYDILIYLPEKIDTIKGENILTEDFGLGSYAFVMIDVKDESQVLKLEEDIKNIKGVNKAVSIYDVIDTTVPKEMLPKKVLNKLYHDDTTIMLVTFKENTSNDLTINAVRELRDVVGEASRVSSMTSMVIDTMDLSNSEILAYVVIAVILCLTVLIISTDSYVIPFLLLLNIGMAIVYNMGTNIFFGQISYITKAIVAVLQLGVTTDFSIFLYHKYISAKKKNSNKKEAMTSAIIDTFQSVIGSSLTTFVGFLALCTMDLTLGTDIGLVMSKGVLFGLICVLTIFPALLLIFDGLIEKTNHKILLPKFEKIQKFSLRNYKIIFVVFIILLIPAYIGNKSYDVYYKLDESLPKDLPFNVANSALGEKFGIKSAEIAIINKDIPKNKVDKLVNELKSVQGIDLVMAPNTLVSDDVKDLLPKDVQDIVDNDKYQLIVLNSNYEIASDKLNNQVDILEKIIKKYDNHGIVAGEGALMKDLVTIADHDFHMVNYTSIIVIFVVMLLVLQSVGLPIILIFAIEFAIFTNMACAYYTGTRLPFIASIVVGTIQLGATIDYAILMSSKYLAERRKKCAKEKAMEKTLKNTVPSIITSALCFFSATIGVGIYTKIDMIGSICNLLARGSIISMLVVILILPSLLMIFDKFILKTTKFKEEK
ncbi:MAG: MMPL family transporter [Bacilli bacterium]|nr:MMPL family transporter [Bacilli bacterium]